MCVIAHETAVVAAGAGILSAPLVVCLRCAGEVGWLSEGAVVGALVVAVAIMGAWPWLGLDTRVIEDAMVLTTGDEASSAFGRGDRMSYVEVSHGPSIACSTARQGEDGSLDTLAQDEIGASEPCVQTHCQQRRYSKRKQVPADCTHPDAGYACVGTHRAAECARGARA